ncbi:MAG: cytochrome c biogenesis protein ResB [Phycisphaerales bacterium]
MKPIHDWHYTRFGRAVRFLGSIQFAVPIMAGVAVALAWGTYLESTHDSKLSRATVYGAWWFIGLMVLICVSLLFAVVVRFPWKRKHTGFITVHAGLIMLIIGGLWSLMTRLEGHVAITEGSSSDVLETDEEIVDLTAFNAGNATVLGSAPAPFRPTSLRLGDIPVEVLGRWQNTSEESFVANDGPSPLRAIEVTLDPAATSGDWIGDEAQSGGAATLGGMLVRVLADGATWTPPASAGNASAAGFHFTVGDKQVAVGQVGDEIAPGWKIVEVKRYERAMVGGGALTERPDGPANPAIEVKISNGAGSVEKHTSFLNFPDMIMGRLVEGSVPSGIKLSSTAPVSKAETLVVFGPLADTRVGYVAADGSAREIGPLGPLPATIDVGGRHVRVLQQFDRARAASRIVEAPMASERRPALVMKVADAAEPVIVPWKGAEPVFAGGQNLLLRFGPRSVQLPFTIELKDFRKLDYPGTDMAMAYESEVMISTPEEGPKPYLIHMNSPYSHGPWSVYQSGFMGDRTSVFSVMRDQGLPLTYVGCVVLCVGIYLTFFSRTLSWGHPGIPVPFPQSEHSHATSASSAPPRPHVADAGHQPASSGV